MLPEKAPVNRTLLYDLHLRQSARMVDFHGWWLPVQYDGIIAEHLRTRAAVTMFDTCHMGQVMVAAPGALDALSRVLTADLRTLRDGRCRYGFMLNEQGGIIDDLIAYRFDAHRWLLVVNSATRAGDVAWLKAQLPAGVGVTDLSGVRGKIDVQGPAAPEKLAVLFGRAICALPRFGFAACVFAGQDGVISRTGYTGEDGYEIYLPAAAIVELWKALLAAGIMPAGLGARDTLRLEAGLPLMGQDLTPDRSPVEAGLERFASKMEPFIGRTTIETQRREGTTRRLRGFRIDGRQTARHGNRVLLDDAVVGEVTSGSFAPTLGCAVGLAVFATGIDWQERRPMIDTGRAQLAARIVPLPFYKSP